MKIKARTKKIIVLSVMVALLVATGVLNWALNDKLLNSDPGGEATVTETFFASMVMPLSLSRSLLSRMSWLRFSGCRTRFAWYIILSTSVVLP